MNLQLQQLIALQETDHEIADLKKHLKVVPEQIEKSRTHLSKEKKKLDTLKQEIKEGQKNRNQLEQEVVKEKDHMSRVKIKLPSVKTNKEYRALLTEVEAIKEKIFSLEDQELGIMETLEEKEKEIPGLENLCEKEDQEFQKFKHNKEGNCIQMRTDLEALDTKRQEIIGQLDKQWADHYSKVARLRGENVVVQLEGGCCKGCNRQVLPQLAIDIQLGEKVLQCNGCYRFLYWTAASKKETVVPE